MTLRFREPRAECPAHLRFIRNLPCVVCRNNIETQAAHVRFSCIESGKRMTGKAEKPDDKWTVPLCGRHHADQHAMNEREFWLTVGIDPIKVCSQLWAVSGDHEQGERVVMGAHVKLTGNGANGLDAQDAE